MASPEAREPGPLVTSFGVEPWRKSIRSGFSWQMDPSRILVELEYYIHIVDDFRDSLRVLRSIVEFEGLDR